MTQPGVSRCIARLEREFDAARHTADTARSGRAGPLRIAAGPVWLDAVLPRAIARFRYR